jgi:Mg-chelatase subunit ChlD
MSVRRVLLALLVAGSTACGFRVGLTASGQLDATVGAWARFSADTGGMALLSTGAADVPDLIRRIVREGLEPGEPIDLVFVVDTTGSMGDDIDAVKNDMRTILAELTATNPDRRIGIVAYRDRGDEYLTRTFLELSEGEEAIVAAIGALAVGGGGDIREHVYAGIDTALREQPWRPGSSRHLVLMGDAPPHDDYGDDPRTYESVIGLANSPQLSVRIHTIGIQCDLVCQGLIALGL